MTARFALFPTTCWSSIERAAALEVGSSSAETTEFVQRYWRPVYAFLRRRFERHDAEDLTQAFFAKFMERGWLARADRSAGRLRTFLLTLLQRFVRDEAQRAQGRFEHGLVRWDALGADLDDLEPATSATPEEAFEQAWTRGLCERAWARLVTACQRDGRDLWPSALRTWFSAAEAGRPSYAALAGTLGVTENQLRNALERGKRLYRTCVEDEVRDTLAGADLAALNDEFEALLERGAVR